MNKSGIAAAAATLVLVSGLFVAPAVAQTETPEDRLARVIDNRDELSVTLQVMDLDQAVPPSCRPIQRRP